MTGRIFDIQRFSTHDGPGIRTTVFFKGCPLQCGWCHNPEGRSFDIQPRFYSQKCIGCNSCNGKISLESARLCPARALEVCGREMTPQEVINTALRDKGFYKDGGGITFSGGECLSQAEFLLECLSLAKEHGLHTAVDTSGYAPSEAVIRTAEYCDLYLFDIKCMDRDKHRKYVGVDNGLILENITVISQMGKPIWIRIPVIKGFNDDVVNMQATAELLKGLKGVERVTLMPYHSLGKGKYATLGLEAESFEAPNERQMAILKDCFKDWMDHYD